jgi:protein gp37
MNKTKIEWCDMTWNLVTGCLHNCPYCYARGIAGRFDTFNKNPNLVVSERRKWKRRESPMALLEVTEPIHFVCKGKEQITTYPFGFTPTFHRYRLNEPQKWKQPQTVFIGSMADIFGEWVPDNWIKEIFKACAAAPQHTYIFLTKNPKRYYQLAEKCELPFEHWYGATVTDSIGLLFGSFPRQSKESAVPRYSSYAPGFSGQTLGQFKTFLSLEPMYSADYNLWHRATVDLVILGAETGNRKGKTLPTADWVKVAERQAKELRAHVFMKDSLIPIVGEANMRRELPWKVR